MFHFNKKSPFLAPRTEKLEPHPNKKAFSHGSDCPVMSTPARALAGFNPYAPILDSEPPSMGLKSAATPSQPPRIRRNRSEPVRSSKTSTQPQIRRNRSHSPTFENKNTAIDHPTSHVRSSVYPWGEKPSAEERQEISRTRSKELAEMYELSEKHDANLKKNSSFDEYNNLKRDTSFNLRKAGFVFSGLFLSRSRSSSSTSSSGSPRGVDSLFWTEPTNPNLPELC